MSPKSNKIIEPEMVNQRQDAVRKDTSAVGKTIKKVLGGTIVSTGTFRFFRYLLFLSLLAFVYIANNYYAERNIREINLLRKELKELRHEYIHTKTQLMEIEKQSQIAK